MDKLEKIHTGQRSFASKDFKNIRVRQKYAFYFSLIILLALILGANLILLYQKGFGQLQVKKGDVVGEMIRAPKTVTFKSEVKTEELKAKVAQGVPRVYRLDSGVVYEQERKLDNVFKKINEIRNSSISYEQKINDLKKINELNLSEAEARSILSFDNSLWNEICQEIKNILIDLQKNEKIKYEEINNYKNKIPLRVNQNFSDEQKKIIINLAQRLLLPNTFLDEVETNKRINEAKEEVGPVYYTIEKDQIILKPGDKVTDFDLEKLEALGLTSSYRESYKSLGILIIVILLSLLSFVFIHYFIQSRIPSYKIFSIYTLLLLVILLVARLVLPLKPVIAYLFPVAAPVMLLALIIDFRLGLFSSFVFPIFFTLAAGGSFELVVIHSITAVVALLLVARIKEFNLFLKLIVSIALVNFLSSFAFNLLVGNFSLRTIFVLLVTGFFCGLINSVLVAGSLVFVGNILGVTSFIELSQLANPEQPLLKELSLKAPGTYYHSILVSNLAESGAKAIGADSLLARVGAYYHDIGKIENSLFFVENQERKINIHEKMDPVKGAALIIDHVAAGLKIAEAYRLPNEIKQIIAEHHGTTHVQFFYDLAKRRGLKIKESDFTYPGPRPSTKESAIIMLADSVEAAVRSLPRFTPKTVKNKIEEIIRFRFEEGQLDHCPLTFRDLNILKESFIETTNAVFHQRIDYLKSEKPFEKLIGASWLTFKKLK